MNVLETNSRIHILINTSDQRHLLMFAVGITKSDKSFRILMIILSVLLYSLRQKCIDLSLNSLKIYLVIHLPMYGLFKDDVGSSDNTADMERSD
jgi:hypothetical protein